MSVAPPSYWGNTEAPPAYSEGEDLAAQLEQMKATMKLEKDAMMWKMHLQKEEMMEKIEKMRLEKEALTEQVRLEKDTMIEQMRLEMEKRICEEKERIQTEKKEFIAKEKHWSSNFDSWDKRYDSKYSNQGDSIPQPVRSIVATFLKTIPNETVYAIHNIRLKDFGWAEINYPGQHNRYYSKLQLYIATDSKVYTTELVGDIHDNYQIHPTSVFRAIVTFPSEPTPTFWRAVFSQMSSHVDWLEFSESHQGDRTKTYRLANAKLEALFKSFR